MIIRTPPDWFAASAERLGGYVSRRPPAYVLGLGTAILGIALGQLVLDPERSAVQLFEVGLPVLLTASVFYTAHVVHHHGNRRGGTQQLWAVFLGVVFSAISIGTIRVLFLTQGASGRPDLLFEIAIGSAAGTAVGGPMGITYEELQARRADVEAEISRKRTLNQQLTVVNRVLRHNVRNRLSVALAHVDSVVDAVEGEAVESRLEKCRAALESLVSHADKATYLRELQATPDAETTVDVVSVVRSTVQSLDAHESHDVRLDLPESAPVRAHPLVDVAVREAVENAVRHTADATITVTVTATADRVELEVADTGPGIPDQERRVLDGVPETQLDHGDGVGLWLLAWIVDASDGDLAIDENDPSGTRLRLSLSAAPSEQ